jgi:hypothetical protein
VSVTVAKSVAMNKKRKIAVLLILAGSFLPLFLYPLSRHNPFDDNFKFRQGEVDNFLNRIISLGSLNFGFDVPFAFSVLLIFAGVIMLVLSVSSRKK